MKTLPVALQLYTVRDHLAEDFEGTLKAVKAAGYDYVEPAGMLGHTCEEFKAALDAAGLKAVSSHVPLAEMAENPEKVIADYAKLGIKYVVVPYLPEELRYGTDKFDSTLADIAKIAKCAKACGMQLLYHNHDFEFTKTADGRYALDYMYDTVSELATELDVCWVRVGGACPVEYLKKYADRAPVVHLKDYVGEKSANMYELIGIKSDAAPKPSTFEFRPVGAGVQDFPAILAAVVETNAEYVVVEQDQSYAQDSVAAAKQSRDYLKTLGW